MTRYEYACQAFDAVSKGDGWRIVGVGPVEDRQRAEVDVQAWRRDGYLVRLIRRPVDAWEPVP